MTASTDIDGGQSSTHNEQTPGATVEPTTTATPPEEQVVADPAEAFAALGLGHDALRAIRELGYGEPTPIQQQTIGELLAGRDVIGQAPTGTGKTAAFGLPIVERLDVNQLAPQALIIVPTRELCIQVAEAMHTLGKFRELVSLPIYGGQPYERQFRALARGVQVVVGTPGRLLDHLNRKTLDLSTVKMVVLDEADEMLDMGFLEDIENILSTLPGQHQSALFSATIPPRISRLAEQYLHNPIRVSVAAREAVAPRVRQVYYELPYQAKSEVLSRILDLETPESAIVFVNTRRDADMVSEQLNGLGYLAQAIHGEITQAQRERSLERFRSGRTQVLVATDVAARGLDIPDVSHIINYDLPLDAESYVHRIGRTGRAGRSGEAITLVTPRERRQLRLIEQGIHRNLERLRLPTPADVAARRRMAFREEVLSILDGGQLDPYLALVEDLVGSREPADLAAAAFKMAAQAMQTRRPGQPMNWMEMPPPPEHPEPFEQRERMSALAEGIASTVATVVNVPATSVEPANNARGHVPSCAIPSMGRPAWRASSFAWAVRMASDRPISSARLPTRRRFPATASAISTSTTAFRSSRCLRRPPSVCAPPSTRPPFADARHARRWPSPQASGWRTWIPATRAVPPAHRAPPRMSADRSARHLVAAAPPLVATVAGVPARGHVVAGVIVPRRANTGKRARFSAFAMITRFC